MKSLFLIFILPLLLFAKIEVDISTYPQSGVNGEVVFINVKTEDKIKLTSLNAKFQNRVFKSLEDKENILLPISYYVDNGVYSVEVFGESVEGEKFTQAFDLEIKDGNYEFEKLRVSKKKTTYTKKVLKRIKKEAKEAKEVYKLFSKKQWRERFIIPLNSKITSNYGKKRLFNGKLKSYHSGVDYRASVGTKIVASNDGIVRLAKDRFFAGGSVILDHGEGIFTTYYHLNKILVKKGERVKKNQTIALSGKSGRVTGPHLHFGAVIEGISTNPLKLIDNLNTIFVK